MSDHILMIYRGGKPKAKVAAKGQEYGKYFQQVSEQVTKKLKLSVNDNCHMLINNEVIYSSQELGDCVSRISTKKVQITVEVCSFILCWLG